MKTFLFAIGTFLGFLLGLAYGQRQIEKVLTDKQMILDEYNRVADKANEQGEALNKMKDAMGF